MTLQWQKVLTLSLTICTINLMNFSQTTTIRCKSFVKVWLNPILHGGWFTEPPLVDDLSWFLSGCSKWAQISWLCFFQHFPCPIEAIFQKRVLKNWKKQFLIVPTSKGPPFEKKNFEINFFHFLVTNPTYFYLNLNSKCS